eukprot:TRINITY_DN30775_c0_g1_i1.p1 TRINITY_DN30775_c0_g1~~TRINITY_DN30775_c0_g1_i1.p1  ORF type:complete len:799 (-),score=190.34 TRINITY_DN30775_c0_g1_i1:74-2470(-)
MAAFAAAPAAASASSSLRHLASVGTCGIATPASLSRARVAPRCAVLSAATCPRGLLLPQRRGKFDVARVPPWKRWPRHGPLRIHVSRLPDVEPSFDVLACDDGERVADALCEVVPWKRRRTDHEWLRAVCGHLRRLAPEMESRDLVRVLIAFGELHTKRKTHTLLFHDYETFTMLFQALPVEAITSKTLVPLLRCYRRMEVSHEAFLRVAADRVVDGHVELSPAQLVEFVRILGHLKIRVPKLFDFVGEVFDLRFPYFSEDHVGDLARAFTGLRYYCKTFLDTLGRELPYRLHEYAWWNLIDIGEMYVELNIDNREIAQRIGNETYKLVFSMKYGYNAKALRILATLDVGDTRTYRSLIRSLPKQVWKFPPNVSAETIIACAAVGVEPDIVYHRLRGNALYCMLTHQLARDVGSLSAKMTCDVFAALAKAGSKEPEMKMALEAVVAQRPYKFHAEHLCSLLRDLGAVGLKSPQVRELLLRRRHELPDCTPSGLSAVPRALAAHPRPYVANGSDPSAAAAESSTLEAELLEDVARLLCTPGEYQLPSDGRVFRSKDDLWFQRLKQRHFRLRRKARLAGKAVAPGAPSEASASSGALVRVEDDASAEGGAVEHLSRAECLQLLEGCRQLDWRDDRLLAGVARWLCAGSRHAELSPTELAQLLRAFAELGFATPLLRAALEHALLRVAGDLAAEDCARALGGALDLGISARSEAIRALLRRCTAQLGLVPLENAGAFVALGAAVRRSADQEVDAALARGFGGEETSASPAAALRMPLEFHLFGEAVEARFGPGARRAVPGM